MPIKTWVMLESRDFTSDERIYMPLYLEGPSAGGTLRIRADLLSSPAPPPPPEVKEEPIILEPLPEEETTITLTGGGTITLEETEPITTVIEPTTTEEPIEPKTTETTTTKEAFGGVFVGPTLAPLSTFNIWIGRAAVLVYSMRHTASFDIAIPVNFFQDVPLVESAYEEPPAESGGGGGDIVETTFIRSFGNPLELGDFGNIFMLPEGESLYPVISPETSVTTIPKLNLGYHPAFIEVITNGNTWRVHIEIEYDYERTGTAADYADPPIIRNILVNKTMNGLARISWNTNVRCDRNWVTYGIGQNLETPIDSNLVEASTSSLYPSANLTMNDGSFYTMQVFSELKGRITNTEPFFWKMPDSHISKSVDLDSLANSGGGLVGDGVVVDIDGDQELVPGGPSLPIIPIIIVGGIAAAGIGGAAWFILKRKKA